MTRYLSSCFIEGFVFMGYPLWSVVIQGVTMLDNLSQSTFEYITKFHNYFHYEGNL